MQLRRSHPHVTDPQIRQYRQFGLGVFSTSRSHILFAGIQQLHTPSMTLSPRSRTPSLVFSRRLDLSELSAHPPVSNTLCHFRTSQHGLARLLAIVSGFWSCRRARCPELNPKTSLGCQKKSRGLVSKTRSCQLP